MQSDRPPQPQAPSRDVSIVEPFEGLTALFEDRLRESLAPSGMLFDRRRIGDTWRPTRGTEGLTSTAIALIGLSRAKVEPERVGLDPRRTLDLLINLVDRAPSPGALGLVLWASAVWGGPSTSGLLEKRAGRAGGTASMARRLRTMELAWLVSGLAHQCRIDPSAVIRSGFDIALAALLGRFEPASRTFRHAEVDSPWALRVRRWVATFADQIYPVQALALASIVADDARALDVAASGALRMAELQGALGQWWWHYDSRDGRVSGSYPVYSVHQHGMAPMSFRTLAMAGGPDLSGAIKAGRDWLFQNELGVKLVDRQAGTIWRSIVRDEGPVRRLVRHTLRLAGPRDDDRPSGSPLRLRLNRETRPYEWGWYLFSSAIESGPSPPEHLG